jgi:hypothetical protein
MNSDSIKVWSNCYHWFSVKEMLLPDVACNKPILINHSCHSEEVMVK